MSKHIDERTVANTTTTVVEKPTGANLDEQDLLLVANYIGVTKKILGISSESDQDVQDALSNLADEAQKVVKRLLKPHSTGEDKGRKKIHKIIQAIKEGKEADLDDIQLAEQHQPRYTQEELVNFILSHREEFPTKETNGSNIDLSWQLGAFIEARLRQIKITRDEFAESLQVERELVDSLLDGEIPPAEIRDFMLEDIAVVIGHHVNMLRIILKRPLVNTTSPENEDT